MNAYWLTRLDNINQFLAWSLVVVVLIIAASISRFLNGNELEKNDAVHLIKVMILALIIIGLALVFIPTRGDMEFINSTK